MADMVSADTHTQLSVCKVLTELAKKAIFPKRSESYVSCKMLYQLKDIIHITNSIKGKLLLLQDFPVKTFARK
jgi:hypothetical protein